MPASPLTSFEESPHHYNSDGSQYYAYGRSIRDDVYVEQDYRDMMDRNYGVYKESQDINDLNQRDRQDLETGRYTASSRDRFYTPEMQNMYHEYGLGGLMQAKEKKYINNSRIY